MAIEAGREPLSVCIVHNSYLQRGGEDAVVEAERNMLEKRGHRVVLFNMDNRNIESMSKAVVAWKTFWNEAGRRKIQAALVAHRPDVVHFHNTFPLISPSGYHAARNEGLPVVQTLHNFRLICPKAVLFRAGAVCEECVERPAPWPAVRHRCYKGSAMGSLVVAGMLQYHRILGTWREQVDLYLTPSEDQRQRLIAGGLDPSRLRVKPNFTAPPVQPSGQRDGVLFVGRLSEEKGLQVLLDAWLSDAGLPRLQIVGDGPLRARVEARAAADPRIAILGEQPPNEVCRLLGRAEAVVVPSVWHEVFGMVVIEAFAVGTPVLASGRGALAELVVPGRTGLHFDPDRPEGLADTVREAFGDLPRLRAMGERAREVWRSTYSPEVNYRQLLAAYRQAAMNHRARRQRRR